MFGKSFSDHMLTVDWNIKEGWGQPKIIPYGDIPLSPASTCLQYGVEVIVFILSYNDLLY